ncbi:MAG: DUF4160 domain-containing protein [Calditrichota bacterium]
MHIHVFSANGEAKYWIEPEVELANNYGFSAKEVRIIQKIIEERQDEIAASWNKHFKG